jgi:hypothetical protein
MSPVWALPVLVFAFGGVALLALLKGTADAVQDLGAELARFGEVQRSVNQIRSGLTQGNEAARRVRERRR